MTETTPREPVEVHVTGADQQEAARLLLASAEKLGHDVGVVQTIGGGFLVPHDVAVDAGALDAEVDDDPDESEDAEQVTGERTPFSGGPDTSTLQGAPGDGGEAGTLGEGEQLTVNEQNAAQDAATGDTDDVQGTQEAPVELRGESLEAALKERGLSTSGTADEKRARVAEHDASQQ